MSSVPSSASIYTDFEGLNQLRHAARDDSPETLRAVAQQFEALFVQMMLKNMRAASFGDELFDSDQSKFYQGMFDQQIAIHMSETSGMGLADLLVKQLGGGGQASPAGPHTSADMYASIERSGDSED